MSPTRVVTVDLPLLPVMPMTGARAWRANSSMSPITGTPAALSAFTKGSSSETPGETTASVNWLSGSGAAKAPRWKSAFWNSALSPSTPEGAGRESVTATLAPSRAR